MFPVHYHGVQSSFACFIFLKTKARGLVLVGEGPHITQSMITPTCVPTSWLELKWECSFCCFSRFLSCNYLFGKKLTWNINITCHPANEGGKIDIQKTLLWTKITPGAFVRLPLISRASTWPIGAPATDWWGGGGGGGGRGRGTRLGKMAITSYYQEKNNTQLRRKGSNWDMGIGLTLSTPCSTYRWSSG